MKYMCEQCWEEKETAQCEFCECDTTPLMKIEVTIPETVHTVWAIDPDHAKEIVGDDIWHFLPDFEAHWDIED